MRISAVLIVKNEAPIIAQCLESIKDFDEIVVVDTGSTDGTQDICRSFGAKVYDDYTWNDDFAEARNHAISKATGDWLFSIDADHVLKTPFNVIVRTAKDAERKGHRTVFVKAIAERSGHWHWRELLFRNDPSVYWVSPVHECLSIPAKMYSQIEQVYGYSKNHSSDPDRNLRILLNKCNGNIPRTRFYLAREYYERKRYDEAIEWADRYLEIATWTPEICEAHLLKAWCFWMTGRGNEARKSCLECIRWNPDFKEALLFMAHIHFEPWKHKWEQLAESATNEDVLFVRV